MTMKSTFCPRCGKEMIDNDRSIRFKCSFCGIWLDEKEWWPETQRRLREAMPEKANDQKKPIQCKDCKHRPSIPDDGYNDGFDIKFPDDICPCQCAGDHYYNWYPSDEWYCPKGEE